MGIIKFFLTKMLVQSVQGEFLRDRTKLSRVEFSVKEMHTKTSDSLTGKGHAEGWRDNQALAGAMKPNLIRVLIQRGALR